MSTVPSGHQGESGESSMRLMLEGAKVLVVDDDEDTRLLTTRSLASAGCTEVFSARDAGEALSLYLKHEPEIVILDFRLPGADGLKVMERIFQAGGRDQVPILVVTSDASESARIEALRRGASDFLLKSFDHTELLLRVRNLVRVRQLMSKDEHLKALVEATIRERTHELRAELAEVIDRLAQAAGGDSQFARTRRVAVLSAHLAESLKLGHDFAETIELAALLRNLGEVYGQTDRGASGGKLLDGCFGEVLRMARDIAMTHQERWDGRGIHNGLIGEDIPVSGRIVAVAQAYEEELESRGATEAVEVVLRESGKAYDPLIAESLALLIEPTLAGWAAVGLSKKPVNRADFGEAVVEVHETE